MIQSIRTKAVFLDLPYHCEYDIAIYQIIPVNFVIEFENLSLKDKKNPQKARIINGIYLVEAVTSKYRDGLVQYIELCPVKQ